MLLQNSITSREHFEIKRKSSEEGETKYYNKSEKYVKKKKNTPKTVVLPLIHMSAWSQVHQQPSNILTAL